MLFAARFQLLHLQQVRVDVVLWFRRAIPLQTLSVPIDLRIEVGEHRVTVVDNVLVEVGKVRKVFDEIRLQDQERHHRLRAQLHVVRDHCFEGAEFLQLFLNQGSLKWSAV